MFEWHWHIKQCYVLSILTLSTRKSSGLDNRIVPVSQFSSWNQPKSLTNKLYILHIHDYKIKIYRDKNKLPVISAICIKMQGWLAFSPVSWLAPLSQVRVKVYQMLQTVIPWPDLVIYADTPPQHPTTATNNNFFLSVSLYVVSYFFLDQFIILNDNLFFFT